MIANFDAGHREQKARDAMDLCANMIFLSYQSRRFMRSTDSKTLSAARHQQRRDSVDVTSRSEDVPAMAAGPCSSLPCRSRNKARTTINHLDTMAVSQDIMPNGMLPVVVV